MVLLVVYLLLGLGLLLIRPVERMLTSNWLWTRLKRVSRW